MSEETILPCPFCGGQDIEVQVEKGCGKYQLWCNDCFCAGPLHLFRPSSIKYWNIRNSQKLGNPKNSAEKTQPSGENNNERLAIALWKRVIEIAEEAHSVDVSLGMLTVLVDEWRSATAAIS